MIYQISLFILFSWLILLYIRNVFFTNKIVIKLTSNNGLVSNIFFPRLNVFSPNPISSDVKIFFRDLLKDNSETKLKEIVFYNKNDFFFLNKNLRNKAFLSCLINSIRQEEKKGISFQRNSIYNEFKLKIANINYSRDIKTRQIIILRTYGFYNNKKETIELIDYIDFD